MNSSEQLLSFTVCYTSRTLKSANNRDTYSFDCGNEFQLLIQLLAVRYIYKAFNDGLALKGRFYCSIYSGREINDNHSVLKFSYSHNQSH